MAIGNRIRCKRLAKGWSQTALAKRVGVAREAVSQWETGDTKNLRPENLLRTAEHLDVPVQWLVFGQGPEQLPCAATKSGPKLNGLEDIVALYHRIPDDGKQVIWSFLLGLCRLSKRAENSTP